MRAASRLTGPRHALRDLRALARPGVVAVVAPQHPARAAHARPSSFACSTLRQTPAAVLRDQLTAATATQQPPATSNQQTADAASCGAPTIQLPAAKRRRLQQQHSVPQQQGTTSHSSSRASQLQQLQAFLGYTFSNPRLLDQACTHDASGRGLPSYRELAFVGDAALWLLFAEHAYRTHGHLEDPISGAWPAHLSRLLSRANCAATARQWGLGTYLQLSTPPPPAPGSTWQLQLQEQQGLAWWQEDSGSSDDGAGSLARSSSADSLTSSSSNDDGATSSSRSRISRLSGRNAGQWTSDTLAEMFEGVVGALLLDSGSDYQVLKQLLLPWVASSFEESRHAAAEAATDAAAAAPEAAVAAVGASAPGPLQLGLSSGQQQQEQHELLLQEALSQQLLRCCGHQFASQEPLTRACRHMAQLMSAGECSADAESLRFLGFGVLQFTAATQAYRQQTAGLQEQQQQLAGHEASCWDSSESAAEGSGSSSSGEGRHVAENSSSSSGRVNVVHEMSKQASELTTVRHRAKMWLMLLEGTPWCPQHSYLTRSTWKKQKQALSRCLDLLLACVYLESGLEAALGVAGVLVRDTPPTTHDKSWMPDWARQKK